MSCEKLLIRCIVLQPSGIPLAVMFYCLTCLLLPIAQPHLPAKSGKRGRPMSKQRTLDEAVTILEDAIKAYRFAQEEAAWMKLIAKCDRALAEIHRPLYCTVTYGYGTPQALEVAR